MEVFPYGLALLLLVALGKGLVTVAGELRSDRGFIKARLRLRGGAPRLADHEVVTVTGTVRVLGALLEAPLSGRLVVFHRTVARVSEIGVRVVACQMVEFELETDDGVVRVLGDTADTAFLPTPVIPRQLPRVQRFLRENGLASEYAAGAGTDEVVIEPGTRISVHGVARVELDLASTGERGFREAAPARMTLAAHPDHPLTLGPPK